MNGSRLLIGLLLAVVVLIDAVAWTIAAPSLVGRSVVVKVLIISLLCSQASLLGLWAGLSRQPSAWRLVGLVVGIMVLSWCFSSLASPPRMALPFVALLCQAIFVLAPVAILRSLGMIAYGLSPGAVDEGRRPGQFSIRDLFAWTTAVAICLGLIRYVVPPHDLSDLVYIWHEIAILHIGFAALALAVAWMVLGKRYLLGRFVLVFLASLVTIGSNAFWHIGPTSFYYVLLTLLQIVWLSGALMVVRVAGSLKSPRGDV